MTKNKGKEEFAGCGGNCACAQADAASKVTDEVCAPPEGGVMLDKDGKCPCGKVADECCHKESIEKNRNSALHELCEPHNGKHVCEVDSDLQKTAP